MSTSSPYRLSIVNADENDMDRDAYLKFFNWIHTLLKLAGKINAYRSKQKQWSYLNWLSVLFMCIAPLPIGYVIYKDTIVVIGDFQSYKNYALFNIMTALSRSFMFYACRVVSIYYFWRWFDYPWLIVLNARNIDIIHDRSVNIIKQTMKRLKVEIIIYFLIYLVHIALYYTYLAIKITHDLASILETLCAFYVIFLPIPLCQICMSCVALSYQIYLMELEIQLNENKIGTAVIKEYKDNFKNFTKHCKYWRIYISLQSLGYFCFIWLYVDKLFFKPNDIMYLIHIVSGVIFYTLPFIEYIICSANLNDQYQLVLNYLLNNYEVDDHTNELHVITQALQASHLYNYMHVNQMVFRLCGCKINRTNTLRVILFFAVTKFVSFSFNALYNGP